MALQKYPYQKYMEFYRIRSFTEERNWKQAFGQDPVIR